MSDPTSGSSSSVPGEIPQSSALEEASPASLLELLSRDPFGFQRQDRDKVVQALRDMRVKWEAAEASGAKAPKVTKVAEAAKTLLTSKRPEDLGL